MRERLIMLIINSVSGCARNWAETIADYLLANGVIVPPCKVGDTVYVIVKDKINEYVVEKISIHSKGEMFLYYHWRGSAYEMKSVCLIGKTVFLTREEAEKALKGDVKNE